MSRLARRRDFLQRLLALTVGSGAIGARGLAATSLPPHFSRMSTPNAVYKLSRNTVFGPTESIYDSVFDEGGWGWYGSVHCPELGAYGRWIGGVGGHGFSGNSRNGFNCDTGVIERWAPNTYETSDSNGAEIFLDKKLSDSLPDYRRFRTGPGGDLSPRANGSRLTRTLGGNRIEMCGADGWPGEDIFGWGSDTDGRTPEGVSVFFFGSQIPSPLRVGTRYFARNWRKEPNGNVSCQVYPTKEAGTAVTLTGSLEVPLQNGGYWASPCYMRGWDELFPVSFYAERGWVIPRQITSYYGMLRANVPQGQFRYSQHVYVPSEDSDVNEPLILGINPWGGWFHSGSEAGPLGGIVAKDAKWPSGNPKRFFFYQGLHSRRWGRLRTKGGKEFLYVPDKAPGELNGGGGGTAAWIPGTKKGYGMNAGAWGASELLEVDLSRGPDDASARVVECANNPTLSEEGVRGVNSPTVGTALIGNDDAGLLLCDVSEARPRWRRLLFPFKPVHRYQKVFWASTLGPRGAIVFFAPTAIPVVKVITLGPDWRRHDGEVVPADWIRDVRITLEDGLTDVSFPVGGGGLYGSCDWLAKPGVLSWLGSHDRGRPLPQLGIRIA